jgi:hypothetical protein
VLVVTGGQLTLCGLATFGSIYGMQAVTNHAEVTWKDIIGGGAVGAVIFVVMIFLKNIAEMRKEHGETVKEVSSNFSAAVTSATKEFAESTNKIIEGSRQHNQANLAMLQQIIQDLHEKR